MTIHAIYKAGKKQSVRTILQVLNMATLIYIEIIEDEDAIFIMTGRHFFFNVVEHVGPRILTDEDNTLKMEVIILRIEGGPRY